MANLERGKFEMGIFCNHCGVGQRYDHYPESVHYNNSYVCGECGGRAMTKSAFCNVYHIKGFWLFKSKRFVGVNFSSQCKPHANAMSKMIEFNRKLCKREGIEPIGIYNNEEL